MRRSRMCSPGGPAAGPCLFGRGLPCRPFACSAFAGRRALDMFRNNFKPERDVLMSKPFKPDRRYAQANREALLTLGAYGLYFVLWYVCAYGLGEGDPEGYAYIWGLPAWFFLSCIVGYPLLSLLLWGIFYIRFSILRQTDFHSTPNGFSFYAKRIFILRQMIFHLAANDFSICAKRFHVV